MGNTAVILMAGEGHRFNDSVPKQFHLLHKKPIYLHTLEIFVTSQLFQQIVLVCHPHWITTVTSEVPSDIEVIPGGKTRQASSFAGIQACAPTTDYVLIHDGVRPFVTHDILKRNIEAAKLHNASNTCIPSSDTIVHSEDGHLISSIPPRRHYLRGQTPQTFAYPLIYRAHQETKQTEATDDCSLVLELGHPVVIVQGDESNIKITTSQDLFLVS